MTLKSKKNVSLALILLWLPALSGCIALAAGSAVVGLAVGLSDKKKFDQYLENAMIFPGEHDHKQFPTIHLEFDLSAAESKIGWDRANQWLKKFSTLPIEEVSEYRLATVYPADINKRAKMFSSKKDRGVGYWVTSDENPDGSQQFSTECSFGDSSNATEWTMNMFRTVPTLIKDLDRNCHILAWYIKSGELPEDRVSQF